MQRVKKISDTALMVSLLSHFFCCVLPVFSSFIGLGATFGLISTNVTYLEWFHENERFFIQFSAAMLMISIIAQFISWRIDCRKTGCEHEPCETKKKKSTKILYFAIFLFIFNIAVDHFINH